MAELLDELVADRIWLHEYPIRYAGIRVNARMTVIRLASGGLVIHSPAPFDEPLAAAVAARGPVAAIVAPGDYHWMYAHTAQRAFPDARTWLCPGVRRKAPDLRFDEELGDQAPALWADELDQVLIRGTAYIREVVFRHRPTRTLVVVDLLENITPRTPGTNRALRIWFRLLRMWNRPAPAPEYWLGWRDQAAVRACMERILAWEFDRVVLAHGDLIERDAHAVVEHAWRKILRR